MFVAAISCSCCFIDHSNGCSWGLVTVISASKIAAMIMRYYTARNSHASQHTSVTLAVADMFWCRNNAMLILLLQIDYTEILKDFISHGYSIFTFYFARIWLEIQYVLWINNWINFTSVTQFVVISCKSLKGMTVMSIHFSILWELLYNVNISEYIGQSVVARRFYAYSVSDTLFYWAFVYSFPDLLT